MFFKTRTIYTMFNVHLSLVRRKSTIFEQKTVYRTKKKKNQEDADKLYLSRVN